MRHRPLILIVEDDRVLRELYRVALTLSDFDVHACEDGLDCLRFLETDRPDAIILDLNLPRVPGQVVYDELRAHANTRRIVVIVVTGMQPVPYLPGTKVLIKPVLPEQLVRALEDSLRRRERTWLFTKGVLSVRMELIVEQGRPARLSVHGPGKKTEVFEDALGIDAIRRQATFERTLIAQGYDVLMIERRAGRDRRTIPRGRDRRRAG
jgi:DNA-binding response OmpR family regulator